MRYLPCLAIASGVLLGSLFVAGGGPAVANEGGRGPDPQHVAVDFWGLFLATGGDAFSAAAFAPGFAAAEYYGAQDDRREAEENEARLKELNEQWLRRQDAANQDAANQDAADPGCADLRRSYQQCAEGREFENFLRSEGLLLPAQIRFQ